MLLINISHSILEPHKKRKKKGKKMLANGGVGSELVTFSNTTFHKINYYYKYILLYR